MGKIKLYHFFYLLLFLFYAVLLARPINLTTQDLGRHIANGRELVKGNTQVLKQNFFSYTLPENKFVNHHWLFGVIVYGLEQTVDFTGIHIFHILVLLGVLWFYLKITTKETSPFYCLIFGLPAVLFLSLRTEVRPESIGLLFIAHTLYQLQTIIKTEKVTARQIAFLMFQQLLWVNTHISFVFGLFLAGLLTASSFLFHSPELNKNVQKKLIVLLTGMGFASLLNPNFITGALQPFLIFTDYGYAIVENQTLNFLLKVINLNTIYPFVLLAVYSLVLLFVEKKTLSWYEILLLITGFALGFYALRNITIFVIFSLPTVAKLTQSVVKNLDLSSKIKLTPQQKNLLLAQLYLFVIAISFSGTIMPGKALAGRKLGLLPNQNQAAEFVKNNQISGPIFNNYDLGSYLIYHHPELKVFTDNRPEAYGKDFFQKIYIPMQTDPQVWQEQTNLHQFQTVIFGVQDITPAAGTFLTFISNHPEWEEIYLDNFVGIWQKTKTQSSAKALPIEK